MSQHDFSPDAATRWNRRSCLYFLSSTDRLGGTLEIWDAAVRLLTSIGGVAGGSVEEVGRGAQGCHARVSVAVHARGDRAVAALLRSGAGDITVGGHAARAPTETYRRGGGEVGERRGVRSESRCREKKKKTQLERSSMRYYYWRGLVSPFEANGQCKPRPEEILCWTAL